MAPGLGLAYPWGRDARRGTPVVVTMENPNYSVVEIDGPEAEALRAGVLPMDKGRGRSAKQFTWVLLLRAHRAAGCLASLAAVAWALPSAVARRFRRAAAEGPGHGRGWLLYRFIKGFLALSLLTLAVELAAYWKGWQFRRPNLTVPELHMPELKKIKPRIEGDLFRDGSGYLHPMVLVQIPMCNEKEVYEQSISAACQLDWPRDKFLIQVLDDSSDESIQMLIKAEVSKWSHQGVNIVYRHRVLRTGYKAGNLKSAMSCDYVKNYEFVAIFDADFQPNPDFLKKTIPHFEISSWKKANLILLFFLLRKLILPFYSFTLFCVILPLTMFVPEAELSVWVICYVPVCMSFLNILPSPRSFPFIVPYLLFENTMSVTKFNAMLSGLFKLGSSYEWIVTKKSGRSSELDLFAATEKDEKAAMFPQFQKQLSEKGELIEINVEKEQHEKAQHDAKKANKIYKKELALSLLLLTAATRSLLSAQGIHFYFLLFQGVSFLAVGLDLIGEQIS
ncbi:hypothetical protein HU200_059922 [Digitaria exilis]|uniref:Glycosyltransferase 2-like domain-containing protein n=1 Tax=Digitaria exilis TaxID=1010633 RepID=A0A835AFQ1_9POAL|nr:hypothetical protein HU200_059922 [Digitaria exilis]